MLCDVLLRCEYWRDCSNLGEASRIQAFCLHPVQQYCASVRVCLRLEWQTEVFGPTLTFLMKAHRTLSDP